MDIKRELLEASFLENMFVKLLRIKRPDKYRWIRQNLHKADRILSWISYKFYCKNFRINERKVIFITTNGTFDCNPKYIIKALVKQKTDLELVLAVNGRKVDFSFIPDEVRTVEMGSMEFYKEVAGSKVIIENSTMFGELHLTKKKGQILINTWHGSIGLKRSETNKNQIWIMTAKYCGRNTDYMISNSSFESSYYQDTFWPNSTIVKIGHPRCDILFKKDNRCLKKMLCNKLGFEEGVHIVLYAPTFRDTYNSDCYDLNYSELESVFEMRFGGCWKILVHFHPITVKQISNNKITIPRNVINISDYPDLYEIMTVCDAGITDYSSWICDFILTKRPAFLYTPDLNEYDDERGFCFPLSTTPFLQSTNQETLIESIINFNQNEYCRKCEDFLKYYGSVDRGNASEEFVSLLNRIINTKVVHP